MCDLYGATKFVKGSSMFGIMLVSIKRTCANGFKYKILDTALLTRFYLKMLTGCKT